jgi:hypothetical protein
VPLVASEGVGLSDTFEASSYCCAEVLRQRLDNKGRCLAAWFGDGTSAAARE